MKMIRKATEAEMVWAFLNMEYKSSRFHEKLDKIIKEREIDKSIIGDEFFSLAWADAKRIELLSEYRGYPDSGLFENYPKNIQWKLMMLEEGDIENLRYIDYSYWNELSKGTSKPTIGAMTVKSGEEIFNVSNDGFYDGVKALESGVEFPPIILITKDEQEYMILEGHQRATVYGMIPGSESGTKAYVGVYK